MSGKELMEGMSYVDERFVEEAENQTIRQGRATPWMKWVSVAACLSLIILSVFALHQNFFPGESDEILLGGDEPPQSAEGIQQFDKPSPNGEVPSVILRIESVTEDGFTGTVAQLVDTDIFTVGMTLNVIVDDSCTSGDTPTGAEKEEIENTLVMVQFIEYTPATGTIVVNVVTPVDE